MMGKESSVKRSGIQAVSRNSVNNNSLRKGCKSLYNINKKNQ